jgi:glycosyltransferase involved in cell wall biosynthesis
LTTLYICYQSITEPLTHTQVINYLEGLALKGHGVILLTFESSPLTVEHRTDLKQLLAGVGIRWYCLRYHKRPTLPATAWDIVAGARFARALVARHKVDVVHARSHVAAAMAAIVKRTTGIRFIFDVRGLLAEEYVAAGVWRAGGFLFRATKRVERSLMRAADGVVVLTHAAEQLLLGWYADELRDKHMEVIPCCVDFRRFAVMNGDVGTDKVGTRFVYVGKLGGWYWNEALCQFFRAALGVLPDASLQIYTQSDHAPLEEQLLNEIRAGKVAISSVAPERLPELLSNAHIALSFVRPSLSKMASSPTKIAEYLAAGLPVISNAGIGDLDALIRGAGPGGDGPVGVVVEHCSDDGYKAAALAASRLRFDRDLRARCRRAARRVFDLESVGWFRYERLYRKVAGI